MPADAPAAASRRYGGEVARSRIEYLLGLEDAPEAWRVRFVAWYDDHLLVLCGRKGAPALVVMIAKAEPDQPAWVRAVHLAITYKGSGQVPEDVDRRVRERAPGRMAALTAEDLSRILDEDPDTRPLPKIPTTTGPEVTNLLTSWAGPDAYAEFFAVGEIQRSQLDSIDLSGAFRFVQHCETECLMQAPHGVAPLVSAVEYPWDKRVRSLDLGLDTPTQEPSADGMMTTELSEKDVIFGNPRRLREILDRVVEMPNPDQKIIFFSNTCVPMVIGEDVESVVRQYARKTRVPLVYLTVTPKSMYNVFRDLLVGRRREAEAACGAADPRAVNLVGYPDGRLSEELHGLLAEAGLRVNTHLIPNFSVARIEALPRAVLSVFYPNRVWANHYAHLMEDTRIRCIMPRAPYGFGGTREWLLAIGEALGVRSEAEAAFAKAARRHQAAWEAVRAQAAGHRVAVVVRAEESAHLTDPETTWGIPLLPVLEEAGFEIEVLLKVANRKEAREVAQAATAQVRDPARLVVRGFSTFERMRERLRESAAEAVLSYHSFDWRVHEAGKNRFSLQIFETGLAGAVRSVERLVGICRTPFYRRYRDYLTRRMDGILEIQGLVERDGAV